MKENNQELVDYLKQKKKLRVGGKMVTTALWAEDEKQNSIETVKKTFHEWVEEE
jgi:ATP-dependent Zn protease